MILHCPGLILNKQGSCFNEMLSLKIIVYIIFLIEFVRKLLHWMVLTGNPSAADGEC